MQNEQNEVTGRSTATNDMTARLQSLRSILTDPTRHTTDQQQVALEALNSEEQDRVNDSQYTLVNHQEHLAALEDNRARIRLARARVASTRSPPQSPHVDNVFDLSSSASVVRTRRSTWRTREVVERDERNDRIERQRSRLARMLSRDDRMEAETGPATLSPSQLTRAYQPSEIQDDRPRSRDGRPNKRRKLDDGSYEEPLTLLEYGLDGTLHPANLRMKVLDVSPQTDGVLQTDEGTRTRIWEATNETPFRCRRNRLTLLMKHQGGWPFSLAHLNIKIPPFEFEMQGLQGMVFVSMDENLCEKTLYYDTVLPKRWITGPKHIARPAHSYRPSQEYFQARYSRYAQTINRRLEPLNLAQPDWYDPRKGLEREHDEDGFETDERINAEVEWIKPEESNDPSSPRSPRVWDDPDATPRRYHNGPPRPTRRGPQSAYRQDPSYVEINDDGIDTSTDSEQDEDDLDGPPYRNVPPNRTALDLAESDQRTRIERMRARQERGESLVTAWPSARDAEANLEDDPEPPSYSRQMNSRKRLPSCRDAFGLPSPEIYKNKLVPVATFQVGGYVHGIKINFKPEM